MQTKATLAGQYYKTILRHHQCGQNFLAKSFWLKSQTFIAILVSKHIGQVPNLSDLNLAHLYQTKGKNGFTGSTPGRRGRQMLMTMTTMQ